MKTEQKFLKLSNVYINKGKIIIPTIKLHLFINFLLIIFTSNCIAMENPNKSSTSSGYSKKNTDNPWSYNDKTQEIKLLIDGKHEDDQFEVKQQLIPINDLTRKILSFINGLKSPSYIIIGISEYPVYNFREISENNFKSLTNKESGIYKIKDTKEYYQVSNNDSLLLTKKVMLNELKTSEKIYLSQINHLFKNFKKEYNYKQVSKSEFDAQSSKEDGIYEVIDEEDRERKSITYYQVINKHSSKLDKKNSKNKIKSKGKITFKDAKNLFNNIKNETYTYQIMEKSKFKNKFDKESGIYRVTTNGGADKYYQVINGEEKIKLEQSAGKNIDKNYRKYIDSELDLMKDNEKVSYGIINELFTNAQSAKKSNSIDSNNILPVKFPMKTYIEENQPNSFTEFNDQQSYVTKLKQYIKNNTVPHIKFEKFESYVEIIGIPYSGKESAIIILKITPSNSTLIALREGEMENVYGRVKPKVADDYSSKVIGKESQSEIKKKRLLKRQSEAPDELQGPTLDFMDLLEYMEKGDLESFKNLLKKKPILKLVSRDVDGKNILMLAICNEREEFAKFLLEDNSNINSNIKINLQAIDNLGDNILLMATRNNYIDIIKSSVNQNSNIMRITGHWKQAFITACENKNWDIVEYFLNNFKYKGDMEKNIINIILKKRFDIIKELSDNSDKYKKIKDLIENKLNEF